MTRRDCLTMFLAGVCLTTLAVPAGAQTSGESAMDKMKGYSVEKKNEAMAHGKKMMSDADAKINALEKQVASDTSAAKADAQRQLKDLKAKRAETSKQLDALGKATAQSWDATKQGFADAFKDMQQTYEKAVASFKK